MQIGTIDINKLRGVGDKFVGLAKETTGVLLGNDSLQKSGEAQQDKATETLKALRDEAKAEGKEDKARSIPSTGGSGVFAETKGKVKQAASNITGNSDLRKEGEADEERGGAQREATQLRASAKGHESKAKAAETAENASH